MSSPSSFSSSVASSFAMSGINARLRLGFAVAISLACLAPAARAEEPSMEQIEEARETYRVGSDSYKKGDYADAEKSFRHVYEILHSSSLLYDLALALEKQSKWRAAADTFEAYLHDTRAVASRKRLEKHVVDLRVRATRQEELAAMAHPMVRAQGAPQEPGNEVYHYAQGEDALLGFDSAQRRQQQEPPPVVEQPRSKTRWWVWAVVGGAAAVAIGVGVGVGVALSRPAPESTTLPDFGPGAALIRF